MLRKNHALLPIFSASATARNHGCGVFEQRSKFEMLSATSAALTEAATVEGGRIEYLDGWRGLAIALVLQSHFFDFPLFDSGRLGVDIFFALSGLLMAKILFVRRVPLGTFYKRRFSRIIPAFTCFVLVVFGLEWARGKPLTFFEFATTLTFCRTYAPADPSILHSSAPIGHLWSLNVEEHSYVLLSLLTLVALLRCREWAALLVVSVICMAVSTAYFFLPSYRPSWGVLGTETVAAGIMASAGYSLICHRVSHRIPTWLPLLLLSVAFACYFRSAPWWCVAIVSPMALAVTVNHLAQSPTWLQRAFEWPALKLLGLLSFSIYLWQQPFYYHQSKLGGGAASLLMALVAGALSFYCLEKPARTWLNSHT